MNGVKSRIEWLLWLLMKWEERERARVSAGMTVLTPLESDKVKDMLLLLIKEHVNSEAGK